MFIPTFVDLQGFVVGKKFIVKEVTALRRGTILIHYIFSCPMSWNFLRRSNKSYASWLNAYHHGLRWDDGIVPYSTAKHMIKEAVIEEDEALVYVKGLEKRLVSSQFTKKEHKNFFCNRCLHYFSSSARLEIHKEDCCYVQLLIYEWIDLEKEGMRRMEYGRTLEQTLCLACIRVEGDGASRTHLGDSEIWVNVPIRRYDSVFKSRTIVGPIVGQGTESLYPGQDRVQIFISRMKIRGNKNE
ncbi:hypothetical protein ALC60_02559 [Trachymyrmex zeteki]|uniref:Uncharacterized protein n=1 Tax=Mycetomoellerius zeteki TaxID=64791 RepID=A0A151XDK0_9HYME|nr:hypothetical protein ALC60_02559 [Trachymyrmex zeteki]